MGLAARLSDLQREVSDVVGRDVMGRQVVTAKTGDRGGNQQDSKQSNSVCGESGREKKNVEDHVTEMLAVNGRENNNAQKHSV